MSLAKILELSAFAVLLSLGQLMFKTVALEIADRPFRSAIVKLATLPSMWIALVLYGGATVLWIFILRTTPLSVAYPFVALGFIIIPVLSWLIFAERLGWQNVAGSLLIAAGVILVSFGHGR